MSDAPADDRPILITGGAGFIGSNLADRLAREGHRVRVFDALARAGVDTNLAWLKDRHGDRIEATVADIRDDAALGHAARDAKAVFHLAAQVAVTTSMVDPRDDFEVNILGTLNLLEVLRRRGDRTPLVFASTNKVYGDLADLEFDAGDHGYVPRDAEVRAHGIGEARPLDFHTPYGCSKGAADQYVLDYARSFNIPATVFRMSCIYGPHQKGNEDQGWVAHFLLQALRGEPITLFGDGKQVRDILWVGDLVRAFHIALDHPEETQARAFNLGGGPDNTVSLLEVVDTIEHHTSEKVRIDWGNWRVGDQRYYVSDTRRFEAEFGWRAQTSAVAGIAHLCEWMQQNANISSQTKELVS